jgi:hypothetical protein
VLTIRRSKTDPHGQGAAVAIWASEDAALSAPHALRCWLACRQPRSASAPLFVRFRAGDRTTDLALSDKAVVRLVKETVEALGRSRPRPKASARWPSAIRAIASAPASPPPAAELEAQLHDVMRQTRHKIGPRSPAATCAPPISGKTTSPSACCARGAARTTKVSKTGVTTGSVAATRGSAGVSRISQDLPARLVAIDLAGDVALEHRAVSGRDLAAFTARRFDDEVHPFDAAPQLDAGGPETGLGSSHGEIPVGAEAVGR